MKRKEDDFGKYSLEESLAGENISLVNHKCIDLLIYSWSLILIRINHMVAHK